MMYMNKISHLTDLYLVLFSSLQPIEELIARLQGNPFSLLLFWVVTLLPVEQGILADAIIVVENLEDSMQKLVRVFKLGNNSLNCKQGK